jgi:DNA helicase IV
MAYSRSKSNFKPRYTPTVKTDDSLRGSKWNPSKLPNATPEVTAILEALLQGYSVTCESVAGSGKTTLALQAVEALLKQRAGRRIAYIAFNKSIQQEAFLKFPAIVDVSTGHSGGFSICKTTGKRYNVETKKLDDILVGYDERTKDLDLNVIQKLVRLSRINLAVNFDGVKDTAEYFNVLANESELTIAYDLLKDCDQYAKLGTFDFDDMLRMPSLWNLRMQDYDFIIVDEAQDLSNGFAEVVKRMAKPGCQFLVIGDLLQGIYGFAGAQPENFYRITEAKNLQLTVSWRCARSIVQHANEIEGYNRTKAAPTATEGSVSTLESSSDFFQIVADKDLVLARTRKSLVNAAFRLYREGKEFRYMGDSPFRSLCSKIYPYVKDTKSAIEFRDGLSNFIAENEQEIDDIPLDPEGDTLACAILFAQAIQADGSITSPNGMYTLADKLGSGTKGPLLSTIHRAKGLEADTVYILDANTTMPHPKATTEFERTQENNCIYVARTRAINSLVYVDFE